MIFLLLVGHSLCDRGNKNFNTICQKCMLYTDTYKWMSIQSCFNWLLEVIPHGDRVGPLIVVGLINDSSVSANWKVPPAINYQVCFLNFFLCFSGWTFIGNCNFRNKFGSSDTGEAFIFKIRTKFLNDLHTTFFGGVSTRYC